jgi:ESS family glutamate:Na+ symporter
VATALIRRLRLAVPTKREARDRREDDFWAVGNAVAETENTDARSSTTQKADPDHEALTGTVLLKNLLLVLALMGVGALLSFGITRLGVILPGYIGAMVVAAVVRNVDDRFGWFNISTHAVEVIGAISLALFLVIALMSLELWKLAGLAVPMLIILAVQVVLVIAYAVLITFILMGRDYEAAVTSSGHIGFGLGITPNAVANMEALVARYAPAPRSFLIVPVVGAFFIDFSNSIIITFFANWLR